MLGVVQINYKINDNQEAKVSQMIDEQQQSDYISEQYTNNERL